MMQEMHSLPKGTCISYMHKNLRWFYGFKPMNMVYLFLNKCEKWSIWLKQCLLWKD